MNSSEYNMKAYEAAVLAAARALINEKYVTGGGGQKEDLICETVPYRDRVVPQEAIARTLTRIQAEELRIAAELNQYELRKKDEAQPLPPAPPQQEVARPANAGAKPGVKNRRS